MSPLRLWTMYIAGVFALLLLIPGRVVQAEDGPVHTTAASFLKMSVGARALAMGGTGVAGREEAWALFVNPAVLGETRGNSLAFSYHRFPFEVEQMALGSAIRVGARGGLGLGVNYVRVGDIEVRTGIKDDGPEAIAEASDLALCVGYGRELIQGLHVGVGGKFLQERLYEDKASSFVLDLGARVAHELLDIGVALRNVGGGIRFGEESFSPPMMGVLGISVPLFVQRLRVAADFEQPLVGGDRPKLHVGWEGRVLNLYVRAGYTHTFGRQQPGAWTGWTAGIGFLYDRWQVDYGVAPSEALGDVHQVSMAMESPPPSLEIYVTSPADGDTVYEAQVPLKGFLKGEKAQKFFPFSKSVDLDIGDNQIQIAAYAVDGRTSTSICTVKREGVVIRRTNWALLIAADTYQYWPELKTPISDADSLRALLIFRYGFKPDHVVTLYNEQATRTNIIDALTGFARKLGPEDNLLIYYAGHGQYDETLEMGYWIPFEAQYTVSGYLENAVIQSYVARIPAQHILMVVDACYSGTLLAERRAGISPDRDRYFREVDRRRSRQVMTSGGQEPVWDVGYGRHSIFAYYFLQALRENTRRYRTVSSLYEQIKIPVANNSRQTPIFKALMDSKDEGGEFIFVLEERFIRE